MKKSIAIIAALLCLTACATTDPQPVETAPEMDTATETKQEIETEPETKAAPVSDRLADLAARGNEIADKSIVALQQRHMFDAAEMQQSAEQPEERKPWWKRIGKKS